MFRLIFSSIRFISPLSHKCTFPTSMALCTTIIVVVFDTSPTADIADEILFFVIETFVGKTAGDEFP